MTELQFHRYVAIGDSSTEGLDDPSGPDGAYRGWADRLAEHVDGSQSALLYANLGVRGRTTRQILEQQLQPALAMRPDLMTLFCGTNDVVRRGFDLESVVTDISTMQEEIIGSGATLLTFTLPDLTPVMPLGRLVADRLHDLNDELRRVASSTGARLVDFARHPVTGDPRLWSADRLHANSAGHARIAAGLAQALELPGGDASWTRPLPELEPKSFVARFRDELVWIGRYLLPWVWRHAHGRSSGDGRRAKRPQLQPVALTRSP